ncbi:SDR family oxidoreductase [Nocardia jiangsuensis]|uniref:SDR family oxidoreductase n=1 Tax=Nocardia jiangsuensis TaxID=1691563 RepID=A0ABV8E134_9NOCA
MTHNASASPDSVALVTGGTSGIGLAVARRLLDEGALVVITGRDEHRLAAATAELGERALPVRADVAELGDLTALTEHIRDRFGRLDVLFANAGIAAIRPVTEVTPVELDEFVAVTLRACTSRCGRRFRCSRRAVPWSSTPRGRGCAAWWPPLRARSAERYPEFRSAVASPFMVSRIPRLTSS